MSVRVERLVGLATLQGPPIDGYRKYGVPSGGAFDQEAYMLGGALVGASRGSLSIEIANAAITLSFAATARVAVTGAHTRHAHHAFDVGPGTVDIEAPSSGARVYVAASGGWIPDGIDSDLGRAGRRLRSGDVLEFAQTVQTQRPVRLASTHSSLDTGPIRVVLGPQPIVRLDKPLRVSNDSDRTGIRLDGLGPRAFDEFVSEPACVGAIQLTPSGQLIVIGPDGPTIGGYPKVAIVCAADLDRLAQLRPGQVVEFETITLDDAKELYLHRKRSLQRQVTEIRTSLSLSRGV